MMPKRKNFYFTNDRVVEQIERQPHQSNYIERLVLRDLNAQQPITRDEVIKLIKEYGGSGDSQKIIDENTKNSILSTLDL